MEKRNEILELSFEFALDIISFSELLDEHRKFVISNQILKSCTSIGANVR
ncbi:MAG: four helix bundle protein, partial [Bacteroidota bacterium]